MRILDKLIEERGSNGKLVAQVVLEGGMLVQGVFEKLDMDHYRAMSLMHTAQGHAPTLVENYFTRNAVRSIIVPADPNLKGEYEKLFSELGGGNGKSRIHTV